MNDPRYIAAMPVPAFVFAKPPLPGVSKTRLARGIGDDAAARLAAAFIVDVVSAIHATPGLEPVLATTDTSWDFGVEARSVDQGGGDLGARLERTLRAGIHEAGAALAVGADSPGIPIDLLAGALAGIADDSGEPDAAFVPSEDGGFAVMAVRRLPSGVLSDIRWSASTTLRDVEARFARLNGSVRLSPWFDVDEAEDLERFRAEVPRARAECTWSVLDTLS